jgi:hypothetical protein
MSFASAIPALGLRLVVLSDHSLSVRESTLVVAGPRSRNCRVSVTDFKVPQGIR